MKHSYIPKSIFLLALGISLAASERTSAQCAVSIEPDTTTCAGQPTTLTANIISGNPNKFTWTSIPSGTLATGSSITVSPNIPTFYVVHSTGNGCNLRDTLLLNVLPAPSEPIITLNLDSSCSGTVANFATAPQGNGITFNWNFGDSTTGSGTGISHTYSSYGYGISTFTVSLTATNSAGCKNSSSRIVTITNKPSSLLLPGGGVDTSTFNGAMTFHICAAANQQFALFSFINGVNPSTGYSTSILWGDNSAPFTADSGWTTTNHIYSRGIFNLTYIVTNNSTGCTDTTFYKVFYGSNPAGGIASPGNTDICGPDWLTFTLSNFKNNTLGTIYKVMFSDSTPPLIFNHPPPDTIAHYFERSSCGFTSSNGITSFPNSFSASLVVENPCGVTAGAVVPIYVSLKPKASYTYENVCTNVPSTFTNTSINGMAASSSGCSPTTPILWSISPDTGWTITNGNLGGDNGYTGNNFNPSLWTSGSNTLVVTFTTAGNYQFQIIAGNKCTADTSVGNTVCVSAPPAPSFSYSLLTSGCAPVLDTLTNTTPPIAGCSPPTFNWSIAQAGSSCAPGSPNNYLFLDTSSNNSTTAYLQFNNQGTYNVSLNAQNVCGTFTSSSTVTVKTPPQATINSPSHTCIDQSFSPVANIQPCAGTISNYSWSFSGGSPSSSNSQNPGTVIFPSVGQYGVSLTVSNECGAVNANTIAIIDTIPVANAGNDQQICSGGTTQIGTAPQPGLTYSWSPATGLNSTTAANPIVTLINNGTTPITQTYLLTTSNAGNCSSTDTVDVIVYPAATVNAGPDVGVCAGLGIVLNGSFGGAASSATWTSNNGGTFSDPTSLTAAYTPSLNSGSITLTLTTDKPNSLCPAISSSMIVTVVSPPIANAGNDISVCSGSSVQIGTAKQPGYTYSWSPSNGLNKTNIASPTATLTNNTNNIITQTYTIKVSATGCQDTAQVTISVYPPAQVNAGPAITTCAGTAINLSGTISGSATSASWSSSSGIFSHSDSLNTTFTPNITSGVAIVTLTSNQPIGPCPAVSSIDSILVNPIPSAFVTPSNQSICNGISTQPIILNSNIPNTTYNWIGFSNQVTGFTKNGTNAIIPSQVLYDTSVSIGAVIYTITPTATGCVGLPIKDTILVNPIAAMDQPANQIICSGSASSAINLSSNLAGVTYTWTASSTATLQGYIISGNGNIPAQTIINNNSLIDSVIYTVTPYTNGCNGTPVSFNIVVYPPAQISLPPNQDICNGATTTAIHLQSNIPNAVFNWTASSSSNLTGYTTNGIGDIPAQTIFNSGTTKGTVSYSIISSSNGCSSPAQTYIVNVYPTINVIAQPATDTVCTGTLININLSSNVSSSNFSWIVDAPISVTGALPGNGSSIQQTLTSNSQIPETVKYIITPSANNCSGQPDTVIVIVNPGLTIQLSPTSQIICSGQSTQIVSISSPTLGTTFSWTSQANGVSGVLTFGNGDIPAQLLINASLVPDTVNYIVVPSSTGCLGQTATYSIVVNPGPSITPPTDQTICTGSATQVVYLNSSLQGATFSWSGSSVNGITGFIKNGTGDSIPSQILSNIGNTAGQLTYTITPTVNGCTGPPVSFNITVNPAPTISAIAPQTICNGTATTTINLSSNISGTTYAWNSIAGSDITGNQSNGTGNIPAQVLTNNGPKPDSVIFTISAAFNTCTGNYSQFIVVVEPSPSVIIPIPQSVCSGNPSQEVVLTSPNPNAIISWIAKVPSGITGAVSSGVSVIPAQVLYNNLVDSFPVSLTIQYSVQVADSQAHCPTGTGKYSITVTPKPIVDFNLSTGSGCSPLNINVIPATHNLSMNDSLVFKWGDGTPNIAVYPNQYRPMWNSVEHKFYNTTGKSLTYNVTMQVHTDCFDSSIVRPVTVAPNSVSAFFTTSPNTGCEPLTVTLQDQSSGSAALSWCFDYEADKHTCKEGGLVDSAGAIITHTYSAGTHTIALYAVNSAGCAQDTMYQTIVVTPAPVADFTPSTNLCTQSTISFTGKSIPPQGSFITQYAWQFGDGNSSNESNPTHTYNVAGSYSVCLSATSSLGCADTICYPVNIADRPHVNFTLPDACLNQQTGSFTNQSTGATFYKWLFGDGNTSASENPSHPYMSPGTYTIQLIGSTNTCSDTAQHIVTIYPMPTAAFTVPVPYSCGLPSSIALNNTSIGAIGYNWDFGNRTNSSYPNPIASYTIDGTYTITLIATNQYNCSDTAHAPVSIYPSPSIQSVHVTPGACQPAPVQFSVEATNASNYIWRFGDGTMEEGTDGFTSHLYRDAGTYSVIIELYSVNHCGDTLSLPDTITVHVKPTADFNYITDGGTQTANGDIQFVNASINSTSYLWNFGDGATSDEVNPSHLFADIDQFHVMLIAATPFGCKDTAYKELEVIKKSLFTPNAFAPDFNTGNDLVRVWKPSGMGLKNYHAQVFDKWGELLWESTLLTDDLQPAEGWDGTYQGKICQQDVYVWKIEATFIDGTRWAGMSYAKQKEKKTIGSVTLIR